MTSTETAVREPKDPVAAKMWRDRIKLYPSVGETRAFNKGRSAKVRMNGVMYEVFPCKNTPLVLNGKKVAVTPETLKKIKDLLK